MPSCGLLLILFHTLKRWGPPTRQVLCSLFAHFSIRTGDPPPMPRFYGGCLPSCGIVLILPPGLKCWEPLKRQFICCKYALLWANVAFMPRCEGLGTPQIVQAM